ncbi:MAG: acyl-CoA dehydrogenase family protein [Pseudodonghicola sp.]
MREYRLEQTYRDARITAIYEGANGIHARMLVTRLLGGAEAAAFNAFLTDEGGAGDLADLWRRARGHLMALPDPTPQAHDFMQLTALVLLDCIWARILAATDHHPDPARLRRVATGAAARGRAFAQAHAVCVGV